jgi:hypothetical protein
MGHDHFLAISSIRNKKFLILKTFFSIPDTINYLSF